MPTYEYVCRQCAHNFEIVQSFSDAALNECPKCKGDLRKVFGNVGITFKGAGFYEHAHEGRRGHKRVRRVVRNVHEHVHGLQLDEFGNGGQLLWRRFRWEFP
jgi:putative FmdB family regulatory protein